MRTRIAAAVAAVVAIGCPGLRAEWKPVPGNIMTPWASQVSPTNALPEYPRPTMTRPDWLNLNGLWEFKTATSSERPPVGQTLPEQILVPFPVESALSGLKRHEERMWYRRTFEVPADWAGKRILLHFGAVDFEATVTVNGRHIGSHRGGYDSFSFDITKALKESGPQELIVFVWDPTDSAGQPRGKQVLSPGGIWYTPSSGIWQTVWLEPVPATRIASLKMTPDVDGGSLRVTVNGAGTTSKDTVRLVAKDGETVVGTATGAVGSEVSLPVPNAHLWTPDDPFLYTLEVSLSRGENVVDTVGSYFGMRKVAVGKDPQGVTRLLLNGQFVFQAGPLDQGFWPDGLYTAPTDEALKYDIVMTKQMGFNMARKHIKVEPERWYYWCDKLGLLVWQDTPSGNNSSADDKIEYQREQRRMIEERYNHPCIVMWVVFNEGWGQFDTERLTARVKAMDPSRLVNNASGWTDKGVGDVNDWHVYPGPGSPTPEATRAAVLGEFGGLGLAVQGHLWSGDAWSYQGYPDKESLTDAFMELFRRVYELKANPGLSAVVYTQTTDVETEINGLMTYDRIPKMDVAKVAAYVKGQFPPPPVTLVPTSETTPQSWRYATTQPAANWYETGFNDSSWSTGNGGFGTSFTPGSVVGTTWNTNDIWLRRTFTLDSVPTGTIVLRMHHDEAAEVYINGVLASQTTGYTTSYQTFSVTPAAAATLKAGTNTLAVHCNQTTGGQFIDVGLSVRQ